MTEKAPPVSVTPDPGSRLEALHAEYDAVAPQAAEWEARLKAVKDAIKAESMAGVPEGTTAIKLTHWAGIYTPLRVIWVPRWDFDVKRLKTDDPATYVRYASLGGRWELRKAAG
jgi:hypothetical protein